MEPDLAAILQSVEGGAEEPQAEQTQEPAQVEAQEPATEEISEEVPNQFANSWAAIKAAEKRNLAEREEVKTQRQEMDSMRDQLKMAQQQIENLQGGFKNNPLEFLEKSGMSFDDLAQRVLNDGAASPEEMVRQNASSTKSEIQQLREEQTKLREVIQEQNNERMVKEYQRDVKKALGDDEFDLLRGYPNGEQLVFNLASVHASEHGEVLTPADAARRIQGELIEQLKSLSSNTAVRKLLGLQDVAEPKKEQAVPQSQSNPGNNTSTLTNALAATPASDVPDTSGMTEFELLRNAAKLIPDTVWD